MKKSYKVYDVIQIPFGDEEHFTPRVIATCKSYTLARGVVAGCNTMWHTFKIVEREVGGHI